ncbi:MAG: beta-propeller fold lactonase family protein, partial [Armatimonadetes bacterium]|nr:beta-propeller fold lactonase family protein [Armatimonadota bacterium]
MAIRVRRYTVAVFLTSVLAVGIFFTMGVSPGEEKKGAKSGEASEHAAAPTKLAPVKRSKEKYRSPIAVAVSPDGKTLYVTDRTFGCLVVLDAVSNKKKGEVSLKGEPTGIALSPDGKTLYASEYDAGTVAVVQTATGKAAGRIKVGLRPMGLALAPKTKRLYVCNHELNLVSVVDLGKAKEIAKIKVVREPMYAAVTPDEKKLIVTNLLPQGKGTDPTLAAEVSIVDTATMKVAKNIKLPAGCTNVNGVCVNPNGQWAYIAHSLGRFNVPPTQLERGWVNTNALTMIDLRKNEHYATMLLDFLSEGAADPYDVVCSKDGKRLYVSHRGIHQVSFIELAKLHDMLEGKVPDELKSQFDVSTQNPWQDISKSPSHETRDPLTDDLTALYIAEVIKRVPAGGQGPHGLALSPNGKKLYVANYYSGTVTALDTEEGKDVASIPVGKQPPADLVRKGEMVFHDAIGTFQHWHGCGTCHPNNGRVDGLNWDLLNDGMGNPKSNKSLLLSWKTPPMMSRAVRESFEVCVRAGFRFIEFSVPPEENVQATMAYLRDLKPESSPYLDPNRKLT